MKGAYMKKQSQIIIVTLILSCILILSSCEIAPASSDPTDTVSNDTLPSSPEETTDPVTESNLPFADAKEGEFPKKCIRAYIMGSELEIEAGETFDQFVMFIPYEALDLENLAWARQHTDVEVTVDHPDIVEIVEYDAQEILDSNEWGGLTIKGLKPGVATITVTCIYTPTGGRSEPETCIITVVDPAETDSPETETAE
jgi:hypothetical protein